MDIISKHADALALRSERATILAQNLANASTPNYKAKDLDFSEVLKSQHESNAKMNNTHTQHIKSGSYNTGLNQAVKYRNPMQNKSNGNTVETDVEQTQYAENMLHYRAGLSFIKQQTTQVLMALRGE